MFIQQSIDMCCTLFYIVIPCEALLPQILPARREGPGLSESEIDSWLVAREDAVKIYLELYARASLECARRLQR